MRMINSLRFKRRVTLLFLLLLAFLFSSGQDTLVRRKYLDSVKNQLAIYTVGYYTYLNMYDRCENEKLAVKRELEDVRYDSALLLQSRKKERNQLIKVFVIICVGIIASLQLLK